MEILEHRHRMIGAADMEILEHRHRMISVASLHVYPVKSCRGMESARVRVTAAGFEHDREWMVVTPDGRFLTQREEPRLALIETSIDETHLRLAAPGAAALEVALALGGAVTEVVVWRDHCVARDQGEAAASWLSTLLGRSLRLVRFDPAHRRASDPTWTGDVPGYTRFSDGFALLVISQASLADLNGRLPAPLPMNRFRPNLVLDGLEPYGEDAIHELRAGRLALRIVKPCTRCTITTTDQRTGTRDGAEPLRTLRGYRWNAKLRGVAFGQNAIVVDGAGAILDQGQELAATARA
jgi:uncharacterized protein YcbX